MEHYHKDKKQKGFSKQGRNHNVKERTGPMLIEDIMNKGPSFNKLDKKIHEMVMHADPLYGALPIIKRKFKPLDNPAKLLTLLQEQGIHLIKEGVTDNKMLPQDRYSTSIGGDASLEVLWHDSTC